MYSWISFWLASRSQLRRAKSGLRVSRAAVLAVGLDAIVTRNGGDFAGAPIPVFTPAELLARLPQAEPEAPENV